MLGHPLASTPRYCCKVPTTAHRNPPPLISTTLIHWFHALYLPSTHLAWVNLIELLCCWEKEKKFWLRKAQTCATRKRSWRWSSAPTVVLACLALRGLSCSLSISCSCSGMSGCERWSLSLSLLPLSFRTTESECLDKHSKANLPVHWSYQRSGKKRAGLPTELPLECQCLPTSKPRILEPER